MSCEADVEKRLRVEASGKHSFFQEIGAHDCGLSCDMDVGRRTSTFLPCTEGASGLGSASKAHQVLIYRSVSGRSIFSTLCDGWVG